jgi:hypothetical protein
MRFEPLRRGALASALLFAALSCSASSRSFIVLALTTPTGTQVTGVYDVVVNVSKGSVEMKELTYPASNLTIDAVTATTLSVNFSDDETGSIHFAVEARTRGGCVLARGMADKDIKPKDVVSVDVSMVPSGGCDTDGGTTDGPPDGGGRPDGGFPGCDPVSPDCGDGMTCQVNCKTGMNECTKGGSGAPGSVCTGNPDCQSGTQCFDYGTLGCAVKVCLRFCNGGGDCAAFGAGGGGPGSLCEGPVRCASDTPYHTCTFNCDPRAVEAANRGGCPTTLACVALAGMDQVDCTCPGTTRTKDVGATCSPGGADCKPGLVCNGVGTPPTYNCRAICRCDKVNNGCTATANDCPSATQCYPVSNGTTFGVCL